LFFLAASALVSSSRHFCFLSRFHRFDIFFFSFGRSFGPYLISLFYFPFSYFPFASLLASLRIACYVTGRGSRFVVFCFPEFHQHLTTPNMAVMISMLFFCVGVFFFLSFPSLSGSESEGERAGRMALDWTGHVYEVPS
jgi:hypothetical protein